MNKIKVLHVFSRFDQGGVENFILNLYRNIDREKFEFSFAITSGEEGVLDNVAKSLGGKIYYFNNGEVTFKNVKNNLNRIIDEYGPFDCIHSHCYFFSGYILWLAKLKQIPVRISHSHETYKGQKYTLKRKVYENVMREMIEKCATVKVGCGKAACHHLYGKYVNESIVINNAVDIDKFRFNEESRKKIRDVYDLHGYRVLGHVGRFEDQKDHEYLISVFSKAYAKNNKLKLLLIGEGSKKDEIMLKVKNSPFADNVLFLGNKNNVNEIMCAMDLFVFPSKYEGLSIVTVESQCSGLPCIVSDCVSKEHNISGNMIFLSKKDENIWVETILDNLNCKRENNDISIMESGYNIVTTVENMMKIYNGFCIEQIKNLKGDI